MQRLRYLVVLSAAIALALAPSAAHAAPAYVTSDPENHEEMEEAPASVRVVFDTPLDPASSLWIVDQCNDRVDDGEVIVAGNAVEVGVADTPKGPYFVQWKVRAPAGVAGGDATGQITFHVNSGDYCGPPSERVNGDGHEGHGGGGGGGHGGGGGGHGGGGGGHDDHSGGDSGGDHSGHATATSGHTTHAPSSDHTQHGGNGGGHGNHKSKSGTSGNTVASPEDNRTIAGPDDPVAVVTGDAVLVALLVSLVLGAAGGWLIRNLNPA